MIKFCSLFGSGFEAGLKPKIDLRRLYSFFGHVKPVACIADLDRV